MRGKNILWISLMLALSIAMLAPMGIVNAPPGTDCKIKVEPSLVTGMPGDSFMIFINVEDVKTPCYSFGFSLKFAPYMKTLVCVAVTDGGFLQPNPYLTWSYDRFHGIIKVTANLIGDLPGVTGSGTLALVEFYVPEGGDSELTLFDTVLYEHVNQELVPIPHNSFDGYYVGPKANLVSKRVDPGRSMQVCEMVEFHGTVKNLADVPLYVRVRYDMMREDAVFLRFYPNMECNKGYPLEETVYKYVTEFEWPIWDDWDKYGDEPWLDAVDYDPEDGGSAIGAGTYCYLQGFFGFEDMVLPTGTMIKNVKLEAYTIGKYDEDCDLDAMCYGTEHGYDWLGSLYAGLEPGWVTPRWIGADVSDVCPEMLSTDPTDLNNLMVGVHYWTGDGEDHDYAIIDSMRLAVTYGGIREQHSPQYIVVQPNDVVEVPVVTWDLGEPAVGKYYCTATCEYKYWDPTDGTKPSQWIEGEKISSFTWWCDP